MEGNGLKKKKTKPKKPKAKKTKTPKKKELTVLEKAKRMYNKQNSYYQNRQTKLIMIAILMIFLIIEVTMDINILN